MIKKDRPKYEICKQSKTIGKNKKLDDKCMEIYNELEESPIPILTDNLDLQIKIERLVINYYVRGFKKSSEIYKPKINSLKRQNRKLHEKYQNLKQMMRNKK